MKSYAVKMRSLTERTYVVDAENRDEALKKVRAGDVETYSVIHTELVNHIPYGKTSKPQVTEGKS